jgi:hypothetical protein
MYSIYSHKQTLLLIMNGKRMCIASGMEERVARFRQTLLGRGHEIIRRALVKVRSASADIDLIHRMLTVIGIRFR